MNFDEMGLSPRILRAVERQGYSTATRIQSVAIPLILAGRDVLGCAQTGTGKTAAFALPTLHRLLAERLPNQQNGGRRRRTIGGLVLTPTRELANQVQRSFATYGRSTDLRQTVIYGGVSQNPQVNALRAGTDIVIATPGRLLDLMNQGHVKLHDVKVLVLDEADQMLDMGFIQDLKKIVKHVPKGRQTLMFSATMPAEIRRLAAQWLDNPQTVQATPEASTPAKIEQTVAFVEKSQKSATLVRFLQTVSGQRHLVFCRTKRGVDRVVQYLERARIPALAIHGNKSQNARERALAQFSSPRPPVLIATDVAARGLQMPDVSYVINYDLPETPEIYVHRIGRTARAGAAGASMSFCSVDERPYLKRIEKLIRQTVKVQQLPGREQEEPHLVDRPVPARPQQTGRAHGSAHKRRNETSRRPYKSGRAATGARKRGRPSRRK
ncbi:MAG: DEAD/DEAH box helicase [Planctomycetes bacterium]|nr:DEAD/DEAH box helicase [Planctomycetota bacterium]